MYDERFCRMFEFYLSGSELAFRPSDHMNFQIQLVRDQHACRWPATICSNRTRGGPALRGCGIRKKRPLFEKKRRKNFFGWAYGAAARAFIFLMQALSSDHEHISLVETKNPRPCAARHHRRPAGDDQSGRLHRADRTRLRAGEKIQTSAPGDRKPRRFGGAVGPDRPVHPPQGRGKRGERDRGDRRCRRLGRLLARLRRGSKSTPTASPSSARSA